MRTAKLDEIVRQRDPALKSTVELLASGQIPAALDSLQRQGRIREIPDSDERIRTIAKSYVESPVNTLIVSPDNASRRDLNMAVRQELRAHGAIAPEDHKFRVLAQRQDMTGADRAWANHYEIGDVVRYARGSKREGIEPASYATVTGIDPSRNLLAVERPSGEMTSYDPSASTAKSNAISLKGIAFSLPLRTSCLELPIATSESSNQLPRMGAFEPGWKIPAQSNSMPLSTAISIMAMRSPATAPRALPPSEFSFTRTQASIPTCSTRDLVMCPFLAQATT
jgi:hypothetical protein